MSNLLPLKDQITYGPVNSRRLGRSLGINLFPADRKYCTFDCLYCQYGWTPDCADASVSRYNRPGVDKIVEAIETAMRSLSEPPAYLTFSGNGEPTLYPDFPEIVETVILLRDRLAPNTKTAALSNATRVGNPAVRAALLRLDRPILKFDAGNESVFRAYNRPIPGVDYEKIICGLEGMREISLQALFAGGPAGNMASEHIDQWIDKVTRIRPRDVQVYSLSRPVPSEFITLAPRSVLRDICIRLAREKIQAESF